MVNRKWITRMVAIAVMALVSVSHAATLLTEINAPNRNDFTGTAGIEFTPTTNLIVNALGYQDAGGDGLGSTHQVGIWNATTNVELVSTTIQSGTGSVLDTNYRYEDVAPVLLEAGQSYYLGGEIFNGGDSWTDSHPGVGVGISSDASLDADRFRAGSFGSLTSDGGGNDARWGPANLKYSTPDAAFNVIDGPAGNRSLNNFTIGSEFTVGSRDLVVSALGTEDAGLNGLTDSHKVSIWDSNGDVVATVVVPALEAGTLIDAWRYETLAAAVTLEAGETYWIGTLTTTADAFTDTHEGDQLIDFAVDAAIVLDGSRFLGGDGRPTNNGGGHAPERWMAANFLFTEVPAPAALPAGLALIGMMAARRRR